MGQRRDWYHSKVSKHDEVGFVDAAPMLNNRMIGSCIASVVKLDSMILCTS